MTMLDLRPARLDLHVRAGDDHTIVLTWPTSLVGRTFVATVNAATLSVGIVDEMMSISIPDEITSDLAPGATWKLRETTGGADSDVTHITGRVIASAAGSGASTRNAVVQLATGAVSIEVVGGNLPTIVEEEVEDIVAGLLAEGANIDLNYNDGAGTLTIAVTGLTSAQISDFAEAARDTLGSALTAGAGIALTVSDPGDSITIAIPNGVVTEAMLAFAAATQAELDAAVATLVPIAQKGVANGVATLGTDGKIPSAQIPALAIGEVFPVASQAAMLALTAQRGDVAVRTDLDPDGVFILTTDSPATLADWIQITAPGAVISVDGQTGAVDLSGTYADPDDVVRATTGISTVLPDAFAALVAADEPVDVLFVGDSFSEGAGAVIDPTLSGRWVQLLTDSLRSLHQPPDVRGGRGYVPAYYDIAGYAGAGFAVTGTVTLNTLRGLGRRAAVLGVGGTLTITGVVCTSFDVVYRHDDGGSFTVTIDGGAPVSVSCANAPFEGGGFTQRFTPAIRGAHTIVIAYEAGAGPTVEGIMVYDGDEDAGVRLWDGSKAGYTAASFASNATWYQSLQAVFPEVVFLALGINDFRADTVPATYRGHVEDIIDGIRTQIVPGGSAIAPDVPVVLVHLPEPADGTYTYLWSQYKDQLDLIAAAYPAVAVVDVSAQMERDFLIGVDNLHPTPGGHRYIANVISGALKPGWQPPLDRYVSRGGDTMHGDLGMPVAFTIGAGNHADLTGKNSVGVGEDVFSVNTTGVNGTALGNNALASNTTGNNNTALGNNALLLNTTGADNTAAGQGALDANTTGAANSAFGQAALGSNTTGGSNSALGVGALGSNTTGASNSALGVNALANNTIGNSNVAVGVQALLNNTSGSEHVGIGVNAGRGITTANWNVAIGGAALYSPAGVAANATTTGSRNVAIGFQTGQTSATQRADCVMIGHEALVGADAACAIGSGAQALHANSVALGAGIVTTAAAQVMVGARDIEITDTDKGLVIKSPDGTRYRIQVANGGALSTIAA